MDFVFLKARLRNSRGVSVTKSTNITSASGSATEVEIVKLTALHAGSLVNGLVHGC